MKKSSWGPCIWKTLHTLTFKIKNEHFQEKKKDLVQLIYKICSNLPCPLCSSHAMLLLKKYKIINVKNKNELIKIIFLLHNDVNKKLKKKSFSYDDLDKTYKNENLKDILNEYYNLNLSLNKNYNEKMILYSFNRKIYLTFFKKFINENIVFFDD